jgi:hypothetical protein
MPLIAFICIQEPVSQKKSFPMEKYSLFSLKCLISNFSQNLLFKNSVWIRVCIQIRCYFQIQIRIRPKHKYWFFRIRFRIHNTVWANPDPVLLDPFVLVIDTSYTRACCVNDTPCIVQCMRVNNTACTVNEVSLTPHAFLIFFAYHRRFVHDFHFLKLFKNFSCACDVNDTACTVNAVSLTPHAFLIFFIPSPFCTVYDFHFSKLFENFVVHVVSMTPHSF